MRYLCTLYARPVSTFPARALCTAVLDAEAGDVAALRAMDQHNAARYHHPRTSARAVECYSVVAEPLSPRQGPAPTLKP